MNRALLLLPALSFVVLGAHGLRAGNSLAVAGWAGMALVILLLRRAWVRHAGLLGLGLGIWIWADAAVELIQFRIFTQQPYTRLAVIIGGVACMMVLSLVILMTRRMQAWFETNNQRVKISDPGHPEKDGVDADHQDQEGCPGLAGGQAREAISDQAVGALVDTVTAQGTGQARFGALQICGLQGAVPADPGAAAAHGASLPDPDLPGTDATDQVADQTDGADHRAMDHLACASGQRDHDGHPGQAEAQGQAYSQAQGCAPAAQDQGRSHDGQEQNGTKDVSGPHGNRARGSGPHPGGLVVPGPDIAEEAAPGRPDQKHGGPIEDGHEQTVAAIGRTGQNQGRNRQVQVTGHEHPLHAGQPQDELSKEDQGKEGPDPRPDSGSPWGLEDDAGHTAGVHGQEEDFREPAAGEVAVGQENRQG